MPKKGERDLQKEMTRRRMIRDWQESGLSLAEYCRRENLKYTTMCQWLSRTKKRDLEAQRKPAARKRKSHQETGKETLIRSGDNIQPVVPSPADFVPVRVIDRTQSPDVKQTTSSLEVVLTNGVTIRVPNHCSLQLLKSVVSALEVG